MTNQVIRYMMINNSSEGGLCIFLENSNNQLNLSDSLYSIPKYLKRNLENSWVTGFAD